MDEGLNTVLVNQVEYWVHSVFLPRLEGITDREYLWEPVPDCWSVRPAPDGRWLMDTAYAGAISPPFTTIAWRLAHLAEVCSYRVSHQFGDGTFELGQLPLTGRVDDAIRIFTTAFETWLNGIRSLGEEGLNRPCGPSEGEWFSERPFTHLLLHVNRECLHHTAEIALLRDLYHHTVAQNALTLHPPVS